MTTKLPLKARLRALMEEFPRVALYTYLALSLVAIVGFTLAIGLGFRASDASGIAGTLFAGWAAAKLTMPLRIIATLALTPVIAAFITRRRDAREAALAARLQADDKA